MCALCIATASWFVGTTLLPAALAAVLKVPRASPPTTALQPCVRINFPSKHLKGKETNSHA